MQPTSMTTRFRSLIAMLIATWSICGAGIANAQSTWHVPADFATIQEAINAASVGDEIIIAPGTYNEMINFLGKAIHLRSSGGASETILDAEGAGTVVTCNSGEGPDTILEGFTITGGYAPTGGGMLNSGSSPQVVNCVFVDNVAEMGGGGMMNVNNSNPDIVDCVFHNNFAGVQGGGMFNGLSTPSITNCLFHANAAEQEGGAIFNHSTASAEITNTTFCENTPDDIQGLWTNLGGNVFNCFSCAGSCGGQAPGGCWCDEGCLKNGDCCLDVCATCSLACPDLIIVPDDLSTIQAAIDFAGDGTEIIVAPGIYNEVINFNGKAIHLRSSDGPEVTIIDATGLDTSVVTCNNGEGPETILEGFTITGGAALDGGEMRNLGSSPTVSNCIFHGNFATYNGGGIHNVSSSNPTVGDTVFCENVPHHITGNWTDAGGNEFFAICPWTKSIAAHVPKDYGTIQEAIDDVPWGSEIIVAPGTYNEAINFGGKAVHLHSSDGPEVTIIDASGLGLTSVVTCDSGEGPDTILDGFTITGGTGTDIFSTVGGGMYNASSSPSVMNCRFVSNTAWNGGGMYNEGDSSPVVINCLFEGNSAGLSGGAIDNALGGTAQIADTVFCENDPDHIVGPWDDLGGNAFCDKCSELIHVPGDYDSIQQAIDAVQCSAEIIVAPGMYNEAINFGGKAIHLRSSDGPEVTIIDATGLDTSVVTCNNGEGPDTILDGFTITGGTGTIDEVLMESNGGGMYNLNSSPTVTNCHFVDNVIDFWGGGNGGGMYNSGSSPTVIDCVFADNAAPHGGGIANILSDPTITGCTFTNNSAPNWGFISGVGGGIFNNASNPMVEDCLFENNEAGNAGGGLYSDSSLTVANCTFIGNTAGHGGGIYDGSGPGSTAIVTNCTFEGNFANTGGGMLNIGNNATVTECTFIGNLAEAHGGGMFNQINSTVVVMHCAFIGNSAGHEGGGMRNHQNSNPIVTNCVFESNSAGSDGGAIMSTLNSTPAITDTYFCANTLEYIGGQWDDLGGNEFFDKCPDCPGDLNGDDEVNIDDLLIVLNNWGECPGGTPGCAGDLNGDGVVNVNDLLELLSQWGPCP